MAHLQERWPDQLGELPAPFESPDSISQLRDKLDLSFGMLDPAVETELSASPDEWRGKSSPFHGYCLITFPLWAALVLEPEDPTSKEQFERVLATLVGQVMWFISETVSQEKYEAHLIAWEGEPAEAAANGNESTAELGESEPVGTSPLAYISSLASAERTLRRLVDPKLDPIWASIGQLFPRPFTLAELAEKLPTVPGVKKEISDYFRRLSQVHRLYQGDGASRSSPGHGGLRGPKKDLGDGRYIEGKRWLAQNDLPVAGSKKAGAVDVKKLPDNFTELLDEDYCPDELTNQDGGSYLHIAEENSADMPKSALRILNKWHYQQSQAQNQVLEWSLDAMTNTQTQSLLKELQTLAADDDQDTVVAKMLVHASFVSSRSIENVIEGLEVTRPSTLAGAAIDYVLGNKTWRLTIKKPVLLTPESHRSQGSDTYQDFLIIPDLLGFDTLVSRWRSFNPDFVARRRVFPIDELRRDGVRTALRALLNRLKECGMTLAKIASGLARRIYQEHGDLSWTALWSDWQPAHSRTILYYLSPEAHLVEGVVASALYQLSHQKSHWTPPPAPAKVRRVGMLNCPSRGQVHALISAYQELLGKDPGHDRTQIQKYSNHYVAYHVLFQTAALAYRAKIDPDPLYSEFNGLLLAMFTDKDSEKYNRRIVPAPPIFREQLGYVDAHLQKVRDSFIDECLAGGDPRMIWFAGGRVSPFRPRFIMNTPPANWQFKINALRRRMRTRLLEKKAPGAVVDAWMGHWRIGDCPWMSGSGFQTRELEDMVNHYVQEILIEDGWVPIPSLLLRSR